jgi:branched-chain amino acid transport system ATP-binding protein
MAVEQNARPALEISHRSYVFEIGKIALSGDSPALSEDARTQRAYLGA